MKQWLSIFSAVLVAGLVVFGIYRSDIQADRDAARWDEMADVQIRSLVASQRGWELGTEMARGPESDSLSLRGSIKPAETFLATAPSRAKKRYDLEREIQRTKSLIAEETKS